MRWYEFQVCTSPLGGVLSIFSFDLVQADLTAPHHLPGCLILHGVKPLALFPKFKTSASLWTHPSVSALSSQIANILVHHTC